MQGQNLRVVHRKELDTARWESLIASDPSASLYQTIWYQDLITDGDWYAVVSDDYDAAMPFALIRKGFGRLLAIDTVVNPLLIQRSIVLPCSKSYYLRDFMRFLERNFRQINLKVEHHKTTEIDAKSLQNHTINLEGDAEIVTQNYNRNTRRNIKSALESGVTIEKTDDVEATMKLLIAHDETGLVGKNNTMLKNLIATSIRNEQGYLLRAVAQNEMCGVGFFINYNRRVYFLLCASNDIGIKLKAMYALIDYAVKLSVGGFDVFDFTGSNIDSIARRNLSFGAEVEVYDIINFSKWF